ncbi:MAG: protein-L-isoaspartate(D-aspartate) O-methyltransferase [Planctomycetales bacterium]
MRATLVWIAAGTMVLGWSFGSSAWGQSLRELERMRKIMVEKEVKAAGVENERVLRSMRDTLRHEFVNRSQIKLAYFDMALPIGEQQTISPPFVVAYMTEQLDPQPSDKVLEIGTGSGYQAAVLSPLVREVYTIEIVAPLGRQAEKVLKRLKYRNVFTRIGDGFKGWPEKAPFDKIIVTCSPEGVPKPLVDQLREGGRMVIPVGERFQQSLYLYRKKDGKLVREALRPTLFVPMTGRAESLRQIKPDAANPRVVNGSFEESNQESELPDAWHYIRHGKAIENKLAPKGNHCLYFENDIPGRHARALQGFAIDGREVQGLKVSLWVKLKEVQRGRTLDERPTVLIHFYGDNRESVGHDWITPQWFDTFDWTRKQGALKVPIRARSAIIRVGLLGAVGEAWFDDIKIEPIKK